MGVAPSCDAYRVPSLFPLLHVFLLSCCDTPKDYKYCFPQAPHPSLPPSSLSLSLSLLPSLLPSFLGALPPPPSPDETLEIKEGKKAL